MLPRILFSLPLPTEADEEMTRVYQRAYDDYPGDPYEDAEAEAYAYEKIDYLADCAHYGHFFDLQKWTDEQIQTLENEKAFKQEIATEHALLAGLFECIPWSPQRPNIFQEFRISKTQEVSLPSPQHRDPIANVRTIIAAQKCWNALFYSNRKSSFGMTG
jgi:hypothetical protein